MKRHRGCETIPPGRYFLDILEDSVILKGRAFSVHRIDDEPIAKRPRLNMVKEEKKPRRAMVVSTKEEKKPKNVAKIRKQKAVVAVGSNEEDSDTTEPAQRTVWAPPRQVVSLIEDDDVALHPLARVGRTIWTRWRPDCTKRNAHERDARIRFDDGPNPEIGEDEILHDYYVDERKNPGLSVTGILKHYWAPFDRDAVSIKCSKGKNPRYVGKTPDEIKAIWKGDAEFGSRRHLAMEHFLDRNEAAIEWDYVPIGFLRFMEDHPTFVPYRVEWSLFHYTCRTGYPLYGQVDAVFLDTATGKLVVVDWKNTRGFLNDAFFGECGVHPRTWRTLATKPNRYAGQIQAYMTFIEREYRLPMQISHGLLANFDPEVLVAPLLFFTSHRIGVRPVRCLTTSRGSRTRPCIEPLSSTCPPISHHSAWTIHSRWSPRKAPASSQCLPFGIGPNSPHWPSG